MSFKALLAIIEGHVIMGKCSKVHLLSNVLLNMSIFKLYQGIWYSISLWDCYFFFCGLAIFLFHADDHIDISGHKPELLISVSSLPCQASEEDITSYFERQGDEVEVCSVQIHGDGQAFIKLVGLTQEGIASHHYPSFIPITLFCLYTNRESQATDKEAT